LQPLAPATLPGMMGELKSGTKMMAVAEPKPTKTLLGRTQTCQEIQNKVKPFAAVEPEDRPQSDSEGLQTKEVKALDSMSESNDLLLGVKLACLAYVDDEPGTIDSLAGAKQAIEVIAGGAEQARKPLTDLLADLGFTVDRIFSHVGILGDGAFNDTQGFIAHNERDVVLSYRGTVSATDALTDILAGHVPFRPLGDKDRGSASIFSSCFATTPAGADDLGRAHRGFYDAFMSSLPDIEQVLIPLFSGPEPRRLILAGHSLGGAIATGALAYLLKRLDLAASQHRLLFVTIGQPRFGDERFRAWVDAEIQSLRALGRCDAARFVHDNDGVPMVPPERFGYRHVGELHVLTEMGDLLVNPGHLENSSAASVGEYLEDHNPLLYLNLLAFASERVHRL